MITAINVTANGLPMFSKCANCTETVVIDLSICRQRERKNAIPLRKAGDVIELYGGGDVVGVECISCLRLGSCDYLSPFDGRFTITTSKGNAYAKIKGGRHNEVLVLSAKIHLSDGSVRQVSKTVLIQRCG